MLMVMPKQAVYLHKYELYEPVEYCEMRRHVIYIFFHLFFAEHSALTVFMFELLPWIHFLIIK
jgi:hypothetical protein